MKKLYSVLMFVFIVMIIKAQDQVKTIYDESADAKKQIEDAVLQAQKENKHVLIQIGGNWCPWCIKMHNFFESNTKIDSLLKSDYVFILINYSKENKNQPVMKELEFPNRFGFPVLVILNAQGKRIHTQNSEYLEDKDNYSIEKVTKFLQAWNKKALQEDTYYEKFKN